jgi:hypothetical protein
MADEQQERVRRTVEVLLMMVQRTNLSPKEVEVALMAAYRSWHLHHGLADEEIADRAALTLTLLAVPIGSVPS